MSVNVALIVAAGSGSRFGADRPKQYLDLSGETILRRSVRAYLEHPRIDRVVVVINPELRDLYDEAVAGLDLPPPVAGGASRRESVSLGLEALALDPPDTVLIHDAARPLVSAETVSRVIDALAVHPGALAAVPVNDTMKRAADGVCVETVPRDGLWRAQTPQGFRFPDILAAHRAAALLNRDFTDDTGVAENAGLVVAPVPSDEENFKVTTPEDLVRAERVLAARLGDVRVGQGYDVHRLIPGDHIVLCGLTIPHDRRMEGHSDADVALHALTDAIFGAIGDGDIGSHFPPSEAKWKGADSALFLKHSAECVRARGGMIAHVDVTIICERPKVGPHREAMRVRLAEILNISLDRVSVKATTTEKLGFTGRGEGIAAQAVATVRLPL